MRRMRTMIVVLALLTLTASAVWAANPAMDGNIAGDAGWQGIASVITDPQESLIPAEYNIKDVYFRSSDDNSTLFVAFDVYATTGIFVNQNAKIAAYFDTDLMRSTGEPNPFCPDLGPEYRILYYFNSRSSTWYTEFQTWDTLVGDWVWQWDTPGTRDTAWEAALSYSAIGATAGEPMAMGIHFENYVAQADDSVCFTWSPENGGGEGCTPGYWKQRQHFGSWVWPYSPVEPQTYFDAAFDVKCDGMACADKTLLQALGTGGGGEKALMRHAVAALLNAAANSGVDYLYTEVDVIQMVKDAYAAGGDIEGTKNLFADENERGCPLGRNLWSPSE